MENGLLFPTYSLLRKPLSLELETEEQRGHRNLFPVSAFVFEKPEGPDAQGLVLGHRAGLQPKDRPPGLPSGLGAEGLHKIRLGPECILCKSGCRRGLVVRQTRPLSKAKYRPAGGPAEPRGPCLRPLWVPPDFF